MFLSVLRALGLVMFILIFSGKKVICNDYHKGMEAGDFCNRGKFETPGPKHLL